MAAKRPAEIRLEEALDEPLQLDEGMSSEEKSEARFLLKETPLYMWPEDHVDYLGTN